jgi:hypothetical protein
LGWKTKEAYLTSCTIWLYLQQEVEKNSKIPGKYWLNKKRQLKFKDEGDTDKMKLESYKGPLTRSKKKILEIHQETQDSTSEVLSVAKMVDQEEERNEIPNNERRENDR